MICCKRVGISRVTASVSTRVLCWRTLCHLVFALTPCTYTGL
jgi:hypothetical protein